MEGVDFKHLSVVDCLSLKEPFSEEEIKEAVWLCDGEKSPGPGGFNLGFFKRCWDIKSDLFACVKEFYVCASLPKAYTAAFLALIPKVQNPQHISEIRPLCLVGKFV